MPNLAYDFTNSTTTSSDDMMNSEWTFFAGTFSGFCLKIFPEKGFCIVRNLVFLQKTRYTLVLEKMETCILICSGHPTTRLWYNFLQI